MKKFRIIVLFILFISLSVCVFAQESELKIHFIDVGEGDSILIQTLDGETVLVDTGNLITGFRVVEYLKKMNIQNLDYLIFTHAHLDHIGGAFFVLPMIEVKNIYDNGQDLTNLAKSNDVYRWYEELVRNSRNYDSLKAGDSLLLGEAILSVLWPPQPFIFSGFNVNSLVIMLEYRKFRCLLTGDLIITGENKLLEQGIDLKADVLKLGHHGANDASCEEFLRGVAPKIAIISVDAENIRGYPSEQVVERIEKEEIKLYRTDRDGDIILSIYQLKDDEYEIRIERSKEK